MKRELGINQRLSTNEFKINYKLFKNELQINYKWNIS